MLRYWIYTASKVDAGAAFVIWGPSSFAGGVDLADPFSGGGKGYAIKGEAAGDAAGYTVLAVGDMNGDGRPDMLVGAPGQDAGGTDAGAAYVVWG
ncbi:MAG: integrin alpha, partial [Yersinia sp. (in: enterobacteria)]